MALAGGDTPESCRSGTLPFLPRPGTEPETANVVLAARRLAILDLSASGHQPLSSPDGRDWIVHNGEIYNYVELRDELERLGHRFRSRTDTEVVLAAYDECVKSARPKTGLPGYARFSRRVGYLRDGLGHIAPPPAGGGA